MPKEDNVCIYLAFYALATIRMLVAVPLFFISVVSNRNEDNINSYFYTTDTLEEVDKLFLSLTIFISIVEKISNNCCRFFPFAVYASIQLIWCCSEVVHAFYYEQFYVPFIGDNRPICSGLMVMALFFKLHHLFVTVTLVVMKKTKPDETTASVRDRETVAPGPSAIPLYSLYEAPPPSYEEAVQLAIREK